jgi:general stress protein 26
MTLQQAQSSSPQAIEHVRELLGDFDTATLVTRARDGRLHGRPMAIASVEDNGTLWFVTDRTSEKAAEVGADEAALVTLQSSRRFLTANGAATLVDNRAKVQELWKESFKLWFDDENDPDIVLLRFSPSDAEYWDTSGARGVKYAFRAAKAYLSGTPAKKEEDPDVHGKVGR